MKYSHFIISHWPRNGFEEGFLWRVWLIKIWVFFTIKRIKTISAWTTKWRKTRNKINKIETFIRRNNQPTPKAFQPSREFPWAKMQAIWCAIHQNRRQISIWTKMSKRHNKEMRWFIRKTGIKRPQENILRIDDKWNLRSLEKSHSMSNQTTRKSSSTTIAIFKEPKATTLLPWQSNPTSVKEYSSIGKN